MTEIEKKENFVFENENQRLLNIFYSNNNWGYDRSGACKKYDLILCGKKVEEKFRREDYPDIAVEIIQDMRSYSPGWFYETDCDYLFYIFTNAPIKLYSIKWKEFKLWFLLKYLPQNLIGKYCFSPRGWGDTLNILVPINRIPKELYKYFEVT